MINRLGIGRLLVVLTGILLGLCSVSLAAAPVATSAKYIDAENTLEIFFDQPVYNDSLHVIRAGISLDGDRGGENPDLALSGGFISGDPAMSSSVKIVLNYPDQRIMETMDDNRTLVLILAQNVFVNVDFEGNEPLGIEDNVSVEYIEDLEAPQLLSAAYDGDKNKLTLEFDEPVNGRQVELTSVFLDDDNGGPNANLKFSSLTEEVTTLALATTMQIGFNVKHQQIIENFDTANLTVILNAFSFIDANRNSVKVVNSTNPVAVSYSGDLNPTALLKADYNASTNDLTLDFNEKVITTFWGQPAVNFKGITIFTNDQTASAQLSGVAAVSVKSDTQMIVNVLPADQRLIESLTNKEGLRITFEAFAVLDESGNGMRAYEFADNMLLTYQDEAEEDAPIIEEATYNATTNILSLTFGNINPSTKGIDTTNVDLTGITIDDDNGGANEDIILGGGDILGIKAGVPKFIRILEITLNAEDEIKVENLAFKDQISIGVKPLSFFFESYTKTRNGNHAINVGDVMVSYIADTTAPEIDFAKYNFIDNQLQILLNKMTKVDQFKTTGVELGGVRLTGGEVVETDYSTTMTINVTEADQAGIEALDAQIKEDLSLALDSGMLVNLDNVTSEKISLKDGDLSSSNEIITIGYGRGFWDISFEAFPDVDNLVETSLRGVGEHCYVFVADEEWRDTIQKTFVDSLVDAFEKTTPADPGKGIYQLCREVFGQERDTDNDARINIVLTDLRDEFGLGRSDRYADLPKAGYFTTRDLAPVSEEPHSNQADVIYLDTDPVVVEGLAYNALADNFQRMIAHNVDANEERWLVEGMSAIAEVICGYDFTDYKIPGSLPSVPFNNSLIHWTGWQAGEPSDLYDLHNVFLFTLYLYEQYGGVDFIKALAAEPLNGLASVQAALTAKGYEKTVSEVFDDYAVASLKDALGHPVYGDKYGFREIDVQTPGQGNINWDRDEIWDSQNQWSYKYYLLKAKVKPETFLFNGNNDSEFSFLYMLSGEEFTVNAAQVDELGQAKFPLADFTENLNLVVCSKSSDGPIPSPFVLSKDIQVPVYVNLGIFQNPSVENVVDIYVVSKEKLFMDVPNNDPWLGAGNEGPQITITLGDETRTFIGEGSFADSLETMYQYHSKVSLWGGGDYSVAVDAQDMTGNVIETVTNTIVVRKLLASAGGQVVASDYAARLDVLPGTLARDTFITASVNKEEDSADPVYRFGPEQTHFSQPAKIFLSVNLKKGERLPSIYRKSGASWVKLESRYIPETKSMEVSINHLGDFKLFYDGEGEIAETKIPETFAVMQNYPNPFNATTTINYQLPSTQHVSLVVYNTLGERVAVLVDQKQAAGYYTKTWDTRHVASGLYFYVFRAGNYLQRHKMLLLK
ncbi:T9SS type A sorting domain-containing protein [candidate division KSB1 bacterium]|nr:T9SS type A sorting domain-containing protein [candidate division KSB1 bacterium]